MTVFFTVEPAKSSGNKSFSEYLFSEYLTALLVGVSQELSGPDSRELNSQRVELAASRRGCELNSLRSESRPRLRVELRVGCESARGLRVEAPTASRGCESAASRRDVPREICELSLRVGCEFNSLRVESASRGH